MKNPSYKCYEPDVELADYLLRTRPRFSRGVAGRKQPHPLETLRKSVPKIIHSKLIHSASLPLAYWGPGVEYLYCHKLEFALKHHDKAVRKKNQVELLALLLKSLASGNTRPLKELGSAVRAIEQAPFDPLGTSLAVAFIILAKGNKKDDPTPAQLVAIAEDFFDMKNGLAESRDSVRASLFRTAKKLLQYYARGD